jgi:hypothetical protein
LIDSSLSEAEAKTYLVNAGLPNNWTVTKQTSIQ